MESQSWKPKQIAMDMKMQKEYKEMEYKLSQCYREKNELKNENQRLITGQLQVQSELTMRTNECRKMEKLLLSHQKIDVPVLEKKSIESKQVEQLQQQVEQLKQQVEQLKQQVEQLKQKMFTTPVSGYTPCPHSCVPLSLEHVCKQQGTPICIMNLIMNAAYSARNSAKNSAGQSAPDPSHSAKLVNCAHIVDLLTGVEILTHKHTIKADNEHPITEEAIHKVIEKVPNTYGLLAFDKPDSVVGHCVCFRKLPNNQLEIWDPQSSKLLSYDDFKDVTAVHIFDVNTPLVQSLSATTGCLANLRQPMEVVESQYLSQSACHVQAV